MNVPSLREFREGVDRISNERISTTIKSIYLLCARPSELCRKITPWESSHKDAKPYGEFLTCKIEDYKIIDYPTEKKIEKVLVFRIAVAKRRRKTRKGDWQDRLVYKEIALPTSYEYEPWSYDLAKHIEKYGTLSLNRTRFGVLSQIKESLSLVLGDNEITTKSLRHFRLTHLGSVYHFTPYDLIAEAGWTFKSGLGAMGMPSGQMDVYFHPPWQDYFSKLLVPLSDLMYGEPSQQQVKFYKS